MKSKLYTPLQMAKMLVGLPYKERFELDSVDGKPWYAAYNDELPGCMSDGETVEMASKNLRSARLDYIAAMFQWKQPVPEPVKTEGNTISVTIHCSCAQKSTIQSVWVNS